MTSLAEVSIERRLLTLRLTRPVHFHFNHGGILPGLLKVALGGVDELPDSLIPFACESGRARFEPGDEYRIGLTFVQDASLASTLVRGLERVGKVLPPSGQAAPPTLAGNFDVVSCEDVPPPDVAGLAASLAGRGRVTLRFVSPLRLERPIDLQVRRSDWSLRDPYGQTSTDR